MIKLTSDELNNLGTFTSLDAVYASYPSGGVPGNYVVVGNTKLYWDEQSLRWTSTGSYDGPTSQVVEGDLSVGGNLDVAGDAHVGGDVTIDGTLNVSSINLTDPIPVPKDGQSVFKSIVFKRAVSRQAAMTPALTSSDGTFYNPVPTNKGWSDGIPAGTDPIWMCSRIFTNDAEPPQGNWSTPELMADTESFDVEFSPSIDKPARPNGTNQNGGTGEQVWFDPVLDAAAFSTMEMIWMATRTRTIGSNGPVWGQWAVMRIKGEEGNDGVGNDSAYTVYLKGVRPNLTNRYGDLPVSFGCTWQRTTSGLTIGSNQALWMSVRTYQNNVYGPWSDAVRISGDGAPGEDGADFEMIFKQMDRLPNSTDTTPANNVSQDDYVPTSEGWYDEAKGVDTNHKYEWCCMRYKERGNSLWGDWVGPFAWSVYGDTGMDGASVQYVFKRTTADEGTPARPAVTNEGYINEQGEYIPHGWTDDPQGVNEYYVKEWVSIRRKGERQTEWGSFSDPALWATYSKQHTVEIKDGYWWIDGVKTDYKAEGEDGAGIKLKGVVDYYSTSETSGTATSLQGVNTSGLEIGDCYVVSQGSKEGYIYAYNGSGTWPNNWTELGKFKGADGDPGTSMFLHIAWSYQIDFPNGVPVGAIYTDYADLPIATNGYPEWQGIAVTNSDDNPTGEDPTQASAYEWNHIRGKDGSDYERVYIRTKKNVRPQVETGANQSDDYKPLCVNGSICEAEYTGSGAQTVYQFTDDPIGPDPSWPYEWMAERKKTDGTWGQHGTPVTANNTTNYFASLWSIFSAPPTITVDSEGYWRINDERIPDPNHEGEYLKAKGEKGDGIAIKNSYSSLAELEENVTNPSVGDCYYITSGNDMGHLFMWNGNDWQDIGEIKGEAGQSQYMFIAWATNVHISGNTVTSVDGFSLNSGSGYNWVGLLAYDSPTLPTIGSSTNDPTKLAFKWNYIKGMDGDQYEYVYTRTTTNDNPGVRNSYSSDYEDSNRTQPDEDEFLPLTTGGTEYTDDPNGVDSTNQFEWECYRRKTAGSWGQWFGPYLVHNWAKNGAGQAYVDTEGVDNVVIDCSSYGKPKSAEIITIEAKLYYGETAQSINTSNSSVSVAIEGFTQGNNIGTACKYNVISGTASYQIKLFVKTGNAISSGKITINLTSGSSSSAGGQSGDNPSSGNQGSDSANPVHSATKVINVIAIQDGVPGTPGTPGSTGPCLRFRGEFSSTTDNSSTDGYVWNDTFRDCVKSGSTYYLVNVKTNGGTPLGTPPNNKWMSAGGNLKFFATELLLAENGAINLLSSNVINLFNSQNQIVAKLNGDGQGSFCIYYPGTNKKWYEIVPGWQIYYDNDTDNTELWRQGKSGEVIKNTTITWSPLRMSVNTINTVDIMGQLGPDFRISNSDMTTNYVYSNSDDADHNGKVYTSINANTSGPTGSLVPNGTYAIDQMCEEDGLGTSITTYRLRICIISGGVPTFSSVTRTVTNE